MSVKENQICRLCLKVAINGFRKVDDLLMQIFDVLLLKLDLDVTRDPIICRNCMTVAEKCLVFKSNCISVEQIILSCATIRENAKLSIKGIFKKEHAEAITDEDLDTCRFCLAGLERNNFPPLDTLINLTMFEILPKYMPEMDFNIVENSIICASCKGNFEEYFKFVLNSLNIEQKIKVYCKEEGNNSSGQVNLRKMVQLLNILEHPVNCHQICLIKEETKIFESKKAYSVLTKHEKLDVEEEKLNLNENYYKNLPEMWFDKVHQDKNGNKMYKCSSCDYESKRKSYINIHMLVHKDISDIKMYKCSLCAFETKRKRYLNTHILVHKNISEIKTYRCSMCTYEGKRKGDLNRHVLVHKDISEIKMYKCPLCAFEAKRNTGLKRHMVVHKDVTEINMQKCSFCDYETKWKHVLKNHMLVHTNVSKTEMHKCSLCVYETKWKYSLKNHMVIHKDVSEIKLHKCSLCPYKSKQLRSLKTHIMVVHMKLSAMKMFKCSLCAYETKRNNHLKRHMSVHKEVP